MAQIFISYARKDQKEVYPIVDMLERNGFKCWIDKNGIESGDQFKRVIISAINESDVFLYMLSDNAVNSEWVRKEYGHAKRKEKRIIPIFLKGASGNDEIMFDWDEIDHVDISKEGWNEKLVRDLNRIVERNNQSENSHTAEDNYENRIDANVNKIICVRDCDWKGSYAIIENIDFAISPKGKIIVNLINGDVIKTTVLDMIDPITGKYVKESVKNHPIGIRFKEVESNTLVIVGL